MVWTDGCLDTNLGNKAALYDAEGGGHQGYGRAQWGGGGAINGPIWNLKATKAQCENQPEKIHFFGTGPMCPMVIGYGGQRLPAAPCPLQCSSSLQDIPTAHPPCGDTWMCQVMIAIKEIAQAPACIAKEKRSG